MVNVSQSFLIEAKIIPGTHYSENGLEIEAGLSWLEILKHSYDVTPLTNAYFNYAVCKCYFSGGETYVYPLKVNEIRLRYGNDTIFVLFDEVKPATGNVEIHIALYLYES
ncbi:hypothetical protein [Mastigocoleus sp. MO_188.B34]|uniref:hypothetical protein n=1 Tax=Mastigocoleus sp. MO_188.B34 TaxID=3036635 RepID=UPI00263191F1|nr:hypothetical protein [Mastigocoleus sp. MO_188.B34]MDJ0695960.1 hypothetical protein [Mastigocoleus sp. MO_188.B34]